jgi:hypothetical protein
MSGGGTMVNVLLVTVITNGTKWRRDILSIPETQKTFGLIVASIISIVNAPVVIITNREME